MHPAFISQPTREWSRLGLGTGTLASLGRGTTLPMVRGILRAMTDLGVNVIDTADSYTSGRCERMLGSALKGQREAFRIVTKAGYRYGNLPAGLQFANPFIKKAIHRWGTRTCFLPHYLAASLDHSLSRLQTDHVDGFMLHDPSVETVRNPEVLACCIRLKDSGKTKTLGISSDCPTTIRAALTVGCFDLIQTPAHSGCEEQLGEAWQAVRHHGLTLIANHLLHGGAPPQTDTASSASRHEACFRRAVNRYPHDVFLVGTRNPLHLAECVNWMLPTNTPA